MNFIRDLANVASKFKEMLNILRNKDVVHFKLTVELYRGKFTPTKEFSIHGERTPNGDYSLSQQNRYVLQSQETLTESLAIIEKRVHEYISGNELEGAWKDWKEREGFTVEALKSVLSGDDLYYQSDLSVPAITAYGYDAHFYAPLMATVYAKDALKALAKNDLSQASYCVDRGLYWSSAGMFIPDPKGRFKDRASTGGHGKSSKHEPVKQKVSELLISLAPEGGWATTSGAINMVYKELNNKHYVLVEDCHLIVDNLPRTIMGWIQQDPERFVYRLKMKT